MSIFNYLGITGLEKKEVSDDVMEVNFNENGEDNEDGEEDSEVKYFFLNKKNLIFSLMLFFSKNFRRRKEIPSPMRTTSELILWPQKKTLFMLRPKPK